MKIVLDTNVLISTFAFDGFAKKVFEYCFTYHQLVVSEWLIDEFTEKMDEKLKVPVHKIAGAVGLIRRGFTVENPSGEQPDICRDKDDNNVLWLAESVKADYIITGDKDLLVLTPYGSTQIVSPRIFWETVTSKRGENG